MLEKPPLNLGHAQRVAFHSFFQTLYSKSLFVKCPIWQVDSPRYQHGCIKTSSMAMCFQTLQMNALEPLSHQTMGLLPDTKNCGLRKRRECWERFPYHRGSSDPDMHHGTCVTHVPWCMPGSLTSGFLWRRWRVNRSRHSRRMRNPQFYVSGKRPMQHIIQTTKIPCHDTHQRFNHITMEVMYKS